MKTKILILGASRYYLKSIETAKRLGYYTFVVDKQEDSEGFKYADEYKVIDILNFKDVFKYVENKDINGVVALNDFGVYTAAYISEKLNLYGLDTGLANISLDKAKLRIKWDEKGQPNPVFYVVKTFKEFSSACFEIGFPVIVKPAVSYGGSRGVIVVRNGNGIKDAFSFATSFYQDKRLLVEEFLLGDEHSAEVLVYKGKAVILSISDKIKTPLPYRVDKNVIYPTLIRGEKRKRLEKAIVNSILSLGMENGCAHVECCTLPNGDVKLFEVGLRPGGGGTPDPIMPFVTGINEMEQYLKICCGEKPDLICQKEEKWCNYHFFTPKPGKVKSINGIEKIFNMKNVLDFGLFVKSEDIIKPVKVGGDRSGFIIIGGDTRDEVIRQGIQAEKLIEFIVE